MTKKIINSKDSDLFRQAVGKVEAVKSDKISHTPETSPKPYPRPKPQQAYEAMSDSFDLDIGLVSHEESLKYTAPGIQNTVLSKLRKGFFGVQAELDLHGLTSESAKQQLLAFLSRSISAEYRCVHVIHGKGYRSTDSHPVLKNNLNRWLRHHKDVQAFCSTPQRQGGAGAVYVLLKLNKNQDDNFTHKHE